MLPWLTITQEYMHQKGSRCKGVLVNSLHTVPDQTAGHGILRNAPLLLLRAGGSGEMTRSIPLHLSGRCPYDSDALVVFLLEHCDLLHTVACRHHQAVRLFVLCHFRP